MSESQPQVVAERFLRIVFATYLPLLIVAISMSTPDPATDIKRALLTWGACALGGGWIMLSWWFKVPFRRPPLFSSLLLALLALLGVATIPSPFPWVSVMVISRILALLVLYLVATQIYQDAKDIRGLLAGACVGMGLATAYAFMQAAGLDPLPWGDKESDVYQNLPSFFGHPNFAAHALVFIIPFAVYLSFSGRRWAGMLAFLFLAYLAQTSQRGAWLGFAGAITLLAMSELSGRVFRDATSKAIAAVTGTVLAGVAGLAAVAGWTMLRSGVAFPIDHSLLLRYQSFASAGRMFLDKPFLGHGPGVYGITNPEYWSRFEQEWFAQERRFNGHVHNDLMEFGIDAGFLGSGIYLAILATAVFFSLRLVFTATTAESRRLGQLFAAIFMAFGIDGLFGFNSYAPVSAALLFVTMGLLDGQYLPTTTALARDDRWTAALRWAMGGLLIVFAVFETRIFSAQQDMQSGMALQAAGQYDEAEATFQRGKGKTPWDWNFDRQIGHSRASRGDFLGAIEAYEAVVAKNPHYILTRLPLAHARLRAAQLYLRAHPDDTDEVLRQLDVGASDIQAALDVCPMLPEAHQIMAELAGVSGVIATAKDGAENPDRARSYWTKAEEHLEEAIEYKLDNMDELYRQLAHVRVALDDLSGAEKALTDAVRRDPHNTAMWPTFLEYVFKHKRFDQARNVIRAQIRELEAEEPVDVQALATAKLFLGNILENGYRDAEGALSAYRDAARLGPARQEVWTNFARFARQYGRMHDFNASLLQAVADAGETARETLPGPVLAVEVFLRSGTEGLYNASSVLLAAVRSYPADAKDLTAEEAAGWAVDMLQEAAQPLPIDENCMAVFNIGLCRNALKQYELARGLLQTVDECIPDDQAAAYALHYADTLAGFGTPEDALTVLEQAVNVDPQNLELRWALARNLSRMQRFDRAREIYDALLAESGLDVQGRRMLEEERGRLPE